MGQAAAAPSTERLSRTTRALRPSIECCCWLGRGCKHRPSRACPCGDSAAGGRLDPPRSGELPEGDLSRAGRPGRRWSSYSCQISLNSSRESHPQTVLQVRTRCDHRAWRDRAAGRRQEAQHRDFPRRHRPLFNPAAIGCTLAQCLGRPVDGSNETALTQQEQSCLRPALATTLLLLASTSRQEPVLSAARVAGIGQMGPSERPSHTHLRKHKGRSRSAQAHSRACPPNAGRWRSLCLREE
jgi:hypothetical protein